VPQRVAGRFGPIAGADLRIDVRDVPLHSCYRQRQLLRYLLAGAADGKQGEHLRLSCGQLVRLRAALCPGGVIALEVGQHRLRQVKVAGHPDLTVEGRGLGEQPTRERAIAGAVAVCQHARVQPTDVGLVQPVGERFGKI